ncbi:MAG: DUF502 domain-containing protein [Candidatus Aureabacteria bacterium]|nr:DUF502 domain-containing protein [Candidatus Auribacterota bacterium]
MKNKEFFLFRFVKKIFVTGLVNILPTILVIAILVIAYNFLNRSLGEPINLLIKKQMSGPWKHISINYFGIDEKLFEPIVQESYEEMVKRIQDRSVSFYEANLNLERAKRSFEQEATPLIQRKESSGDPEYKKFLEGKIQDIRIRVRLEEAETRLQMEQVKLRQEIERENQMRLEKIKWGDDKHAKLKEAIDKRYPNIIGLFLSLVIIFFIGVLLTSFLGRTVTKMWEKILAALPLIGKLYPYAKQFTEFIFQEKKAMDFQSVVLLQYPRIGIYSIGFVTGEGIGPNKPDERLVSVFMPSSPTPFTGYTVMVNEKDLIPLTITVEETIRFLVSAGVLKPGNPVNKMNQKMIEKQ